jgi:adenylate kinase family enzyme
MRDVISPSLVVTLDQSDSSVYEKLEQRRFDPIECRTYNLLQDEISRDVQGRLVQQKEHTHPLVKRRLQHYRNLLPIIEENYSKNLIRINAEESENDSEQVFSNICEAIENVL